MRKNSNFWQGILLATGMAGALAISALAFAQDSDSATEAGPGVSVTSSASVNQTVHKLKKMIAHGGMMVMGEINQGKMLSMTGLTLKSDTLFVGSPRVGKKLFSADPAVGIAIPIRINVYQDSNGTTVVRYIPPSIVLDQFNNPKVTMIAGMLDKKLHNMTAMLGH